jgi:hypothetical protein
VIKTTAKNCTTPLLAWLIVLPCLFSISYAASYKLSPSNEIFANNCESKINIIVNSESKQSNAAEIEITYNKDLIIIVDSNLELPGVQIEKGKAYSAFVLNNVDETTGKINIVATSLPNDFNGEEIFATIHFRSKTTSTTTTNFSILFNGIGKTLDSNIADTQTGLDLLTNIEDATLNFSNAVECTSTQSTITPTAKPTVIPTKSIDSASQNSIKETLNSINSIGNLPFGLFIILSGVLLTILLGNLLYGFIIFLTQGVSNKKLIGITYDKHNFKPIKRATIMIYDEKNDLISKAITDKFGRIYMNSDATYSKIIASRFDYETTEVSSPFDNTVEYIGLQPNSNKNFITGFFLSSFPLSMTGLLIITLLIILLFSIGILI